MNKIAVVTACFGEIDNSKTIPDQTGAPPFDYFSITEKNSPYPFEVFDPRMKARFFKLQGHKLFPGYDILIWIDASVQIKSHTFVADIVGRLCETPTADMAMARHPSRKCIYSEARFIRDAIANGSAYLKARYQIGAITKQTDFYRAQGHPADAGLWWCGLFARRCEPDLNRFFDLWLQHSLCWSNNDQIGFAFLARVHQIKINHINWGNFHANPSYNLVSHLKLQ